VSTRVASGTEEHMTPRFLSRVTQAQHVAATRVQVYKRCPAAPGCSMTRHHTVRRYTGARWVAREAAGRASVRHLWDSVWRACAATRAVEM